MTNRLAVLAVKLLWYGKRFFETDNPCGAGGMSC